MTVYRSRLIISAALALAAGTAQAQDTGFANFVDHAPVLPSPVQSGDLMVVVRGGHSYQFSVSPFSMTPTFDTLTIAASSGATFSFHPENQTSNAIGFSFTASGTVSSFPTDTAGMALIWAKQTGALTGAGVNRSIGLFEADYNDTGTAVNNDSFIGATGNCNLLGARPNAGIPGGTLSAACVGMVAAARAFNSQGGNLGASQPQGEVHGLNVVSGLSNLPPFTTVLPSGFVDNEGIEVDSVGCAGCTLLFRAGVYVVDFGNGSGSYGEQGTYDAAFAVASVAGSKGWLNGLYFVGPPIAGGNPVDPTVGTLIGVSPGTLAEHGVDFFNATFVDYAFRCPGGSCTVSGAGNAAYASVTATTNGFISDQVVGNDAVIAFRTAGAARWNLGREATTEDFIIKDMIGGDVNFRATTAGVVSIGSTNPISISALGAVTVPGMGAGVAAGAVCRTAGGVLVVTAGVNCF